MNRDIDLTLNALFLGDIAPHEKLTEHRAYDREHAVASGKRRTHIPQLFRQEGGLSGLGVTLETWHKKIFFGDKKDKMPVGMTDYLEAYTKYFGDNATVLKKYDGYHEYMSGAMCDCCGKPLNFFNRSKCYTLCTPCDRREFGQRDSGRFFRMEPAWEQEILWVDEPEKRKLSLSQKIEMRKNQFNRKIDELLG